MLKEGYWREAGLSDLKYQFAKEILQREPNEIEIDMLGIIWAKYYSYKNSCDILKMFSTSGSNILQEPGENAGVVDIGDGQAVLFNIESHNHSSGREAYREVVACESGVIRDIYIKGARPIGILNSLRFGSLKNKETRCLFKDVVANTASYGDIIGIPTVASDVNFHLSYEDNCIVNTMAVGLMEHKNLAKSEVGKIGNSVMIVGACTGRDGKYKATFVSKELSETLEEQLPKVPVSNTYLENLEKILLETCFELIKKGYVLGMQDLDTSGLAGSFCEIGAHFGTGTEINIAVIPCRETEMSACEILLSQSRGRMLIVTLKGKEEKVKAIFRKSGLEATVIGRITDDGFMTIKENNEIIAQLPVEVVTEVFSRYNSEVKEPEYLAQAQGCDLSSLPEVEDYGKILLILLGTPTISSKEWVYNQYDYMTEINTVVSSGNNATVLKVEGTNKGVAVTMDCNSRYVYLAPYRGGQIAVAEAARKLVCSGAMPLAITNSLNFGNPEKPDVFWQFKEAVAGMSDTCRELELLVTGGNASFYNESKDEAIYPTPVVGMVGLIKDLSYVTTSAFKNDEDIIILLGKNGDELGASTYLSVIHGLEAGKPPEINLELEKQVQKATLELIEKGLVFSSHECSEGGLAVALAECCLAGKIGADVTLSENLKPSGLLFGESQSRIIITIFKDKMDTVLRYLRELQVPHKVLGTVGGESLNIAGAGWKVHLTLEDMDEKYRRTIECLMNA
ncbi:MAG: phosphoribosylformylglycinamidine synthase subunit PurL [Clostridia bacterium]|nr:phosphoribosylformylglycinamidine synthase subunit PurL [Clostridia bacterium]